jgi:hypothetical protein
MLFHPAEGSTLLAFIDAAACEFRLADSFTFALREGLRRPRLASSAVCSIGIAISRAMQAPVCSAHTHKNSRCNATPRVTARPCSS